MLGTESDDVINMWGTESDDVINMWGTESDDVINVSIMKSIHQKNFFI
ncbi:hypothetical protein EYF80_068178 [Liparis tanakae]|uniref:Uncharacterized protein n=1 Tax=Liparis tanakae TaxID=230148 RepID=A0A4Z2DZN2_9TELE|nr:hypothetical protein EYF80_068178 [Liparis tanakae]